MDIVLEPLGGHSRGQVRLLVLGDDGDPPADVTMSWEAVATHPLVASSSAAPRWIWADARLVLPQLEAAGVVVDRCIDLRLTHAILREAAPGFASAGGSDAHAAAADAVWRRRAHVAAAAPALFDAEPTLPEPDATAMLVEHRRQQAALERVSNPAALGMLLAVESAGAVVASELSRAGMPWSVERHDELLTELLGPRPVAGGRPARLEELAGTLRELLAAPRMNPDSQPDLLAALKRAGLAVTSTSKWQLREIEHPVVEPLLRYKGLSRIHTANGWTWMREWVDGGRLRTEYVPGGVVTGRWATNGGGGMQLPVRLRSSAVADDGWLLVVADAAQLEPRVLAGMARDLELAAAGAGADLYQGLVDAGIVDTRPHAKVAMLGALYGATSGEAGRLMPRLLRAYPKATGLVERAARTGEAGDRVRTWLGRTSPLPDRPFAEGEERRARSWGRFTRNFVVQGTAAEWALCWMVLARTRLRSIDGAQLVSFLHDEVVVHVPAAGAPAVEVALREAAAEAGRMLFGTFPIEFPVSAASAGDYGAAKA